ncbi:MAG: hypothetical protein K1X94_23840 [Sandaracinaceae bacterium]|nr:hypothetical protein [Sandaracinaceae bacterium]
MSDRVALLVVFALLCGCELVDQSTYSLHMVGTTGGNPVDLTRTGHAPASFYRDGSYTLQIDRLTETRRVGTDPPRVELNPVTWTFGDQQVSAVAFYQVDVMGWGNATLHVDDIQLTGDARAPIRIDYRAETDTLRSTQFEATFELSGTTYLECPRGEDGNPNCGIPLPTGEEHLVWQLEAQSGCPLELLSPWGAGNEAVLDGRRLVIDGGPPIACHETAHNDFEATTVLCGARAEHVSAAGCDWTVVVTLEDHGSVLGPEEFLVVRARTAGDCEAVPCMVGSCPDVRGCVMPYWARRS